jgi:hypothetical protein
VNALYEHLASNVGLDGFARLSVWAQWVKRCLRCRVVIAGSATRQKAFKDVDVTLLWPREQYDLADRFFRPSPKPGDPDAWWLMCSALSLQASAASGLPVEVHIDREESWTLPSYSFWEIP